MTKIPLIVKVVESKPRLGQVSIYHLIGTIYIVSNFNSETGEATVQSTDFGGPIKLQPEEYEILSQSRDNVNTNKRKVK